jgi:small subunit ribosomal protein S15
MARMYSRKKGKAGSKKPAKKSVPSWVRYTPKEVELLIMKLAKEDKTPSQIGLILRDLYGIPDVRTITKLKVSMILKDKKLLTPIPEDVTALMLRAIAIRKHLEENAHDETARRGLTITESKIKKLVKYYKRTGRIAQDWKYDTVKVYT